MVPYKLVIGNKAYSSWSLRGWLMARAAEIAAAKLAAGAGDAAFCTTKIATARFYVEHILPQAPALAEEITGGAASVLAFDSAAF